MVGNRLVVAKRFPVDSMIAGSRTQLIKPFAVESEQWEAVLAESPEQGLTFSARAGALMPSFGVPPHLPPTLAVLSNYPPLEGKARRRQGINQECSEKINRLPPPEVDINKMSVLE